MSKPNLYISTDIETDGPVPGLNSLWSLGAVAYHADTYEEVGEFTVNFADLPGAVANPETLEWWAKQTEQVYAAARDNQKPADEATREFVKWVHSLGGRPALVAAPTGFDFTFIYWYCHKFMGYSPFSRAAVDMKSMAMPMLQKDYRFIHKGNMTKRWPVTGKHTHVALDDAREQGQIFVQMLKESREPKTVSAERVDEAAYALLDSWGVDEVDELQFEQARRDAVTVLQHLHLFEE